MAEGPIYHDPHTGHPYRVGPDGVSEWITEDDPADRPTEVHPSLQVTEVHRPLQQTQAFWLDAPAPPSQSPSQPSAPTPTLPTTALPPPMPSAQKPAPGAPSRQLVVVLGAVAGVAVLLVVVLAAALVLRQGQPTDDAPAAQVPTASAPALPAPPSTAPPLTDPAAGDPAPDAIGPGWRPADYRALPNATASSGDLEVRVEGWGTTKSIGRAGLQTADGTYLLLYVSFRNSGTRTTMPTFARLTDSSGQQYDEAAGASGAASGLVYGLTGLAVQPGQTGHRIMAFDVPVGTAPTEVSVPTGFMAPSVTVPLG